MKSKIHEYQGDRITISYELKRCIHAGECVRGLPAVFDRGRRRWVEANEASPGEISEVIERCPSGALHYSWPDGGQVEAAPEISSVIPIKNGPLYMRGDLRIRTEDGETFRETRAALCRCGESENKPFCDNSHLKINFRAAGL